MSKGHNACKWLTLSSTELCGKRCLRSVCKIHLARLRKGSHTLSPAGVVGLGFLISNSSVVSAGIEVNGFVQQELCVARRAGRLDGPRFAPPYQTSAVVCAVGRGSRSARWPAF